MKESDALIVEWIAEVVFMYNRAAERVPLGDCQVCWVEQPLLPVEVEVPAAPLHHALPVDLELEGNNKYIINIYKWFFWVTEGYRRSTPRTSASASSGLRFGFAGDTAGLQMYVFIFIFS